MPIRVLDKHVAELIAAGEVVERPASVIKELVENSIDAGASHITVEIRSGGIAYMRITDDGCGIPYEEVPTAFLRHATSKVWSEDDLLDVATLGFRGEALASVCAVSHVDMLTAVSDGEGTAYSISGGEQTVYDRAGCPKGTTIIVRDLFYNVPARMKFLKKDSSEATAVAGVMDRIALSHPEIAFKFINEGKVSMQTQGGGELSAAIYSVYGREFRAGLIPVDQSSGNMRVHGFICKPEASRKSRGMQCFFINGRYVNSKTVRAALEQAYKGSIMVGTFPSCVLFLEMHAGDVDVNVHPAKLECRFTYEKPVFDAVYYAVKSALAGGYSRSEIKLPKAADARINAHINVTAPTANPVQTRLDTSLSGALNKFDSDTHTDKDESKSTKAAQVDRQEHYSAQGVPANIGIFPTETGAGVPDSIGTLHTETGANAAPPLVLRETDSNPVQIRTRTVNLDISVDDEPETPKSGEALRTDEPDRAAAQQPNDTQTSGEQSEPEYELKFVGEAFATYAIVEYGDELIIIDKHAAHERIIYERLKSGGKIDAQMLLSPVTVTLSKDEFAAVAENMQAINEFGFEVEEFGGSSVLVRAVPSPLTDCDAASLITEIAAGFLEHKNEVSIDKLDWLYHNMACRAAVKGGDRSGREDLTALARRVALGDDIHYCPHGRPVAYKLTRKELEKQFGRLG